MVGVLTYDGGGFVLGSDDGLLFGTNGGISDNSALGSDIGIGMG